MVLRKEAVEVFSARWRAFFQSRFWPNRGWSWQSESCTPCLNMSSFLKFWTCGSNRCELERICVRRWPYRKENYKIVSIVSSLLSTFTHMVDIAPDIGFRQSWYSQKSSDTLFLKVPDLREGELGSRRYGPTNGCRRSVLKRREVIFRSRFWLDRRSSWRSESCTL